VLAYLRELGDEAILCVANLARTAQPVELDLKRFKGRVPVEMLGRTPFPPVGDLPYLLTLPAHAFYWFRLATDVAVPEWHKEMIVPDESPLLVLFDGWLSFFRDKVMPWRMGMAETLRSRLEQEVLPRYMEKQRWYASKGERVESAPLSDYAIWEAGTLSWLLTLILLRGDLYFLPLALAWEDEEEQVRSLAQSTVARVRQQANVGIAGDAIADEAFCRHVVKAIGDARVLPTATGTIRFTPTGSFAEIAGDDVVGLTLGRVHTQSTNTSVTLGDRLFLKCYRRVRAGVNPELEMGRFLTEVARFPNCVPVAGAVEYASGAGEPATLALLQKYVPNQGDGWQYTLGYLDRALEARREEGHGAYLTLIQVLANRTAELHRALAAPSGDPAFEPEPFTEEDFQKLRQRVKDEMGQTVDLLAGSDFRLPKDRLIALIEACPAPRSPVVKTRTHGDYHLGQVLLANNDFIITDFEGEPSRPLAESRRKHVPLRDVAGMLRSFSYAKWSALERLDSKDAGPLDAWEAETRAAFLAAYGAPLDDLGGLLRLFELEKLAYEIRYELANRPAWVHVPVRGAFAMLEGKG
jgi:maltose alpha-D-glucosyltransferase/alpha-amylase